MCQAKSSLCGRFWDHVSYDRRASLLVDYIVRVADHKTAEVAPGVITLEPHIHQLLCKYIIIRQHVLDSVNPVPRPASIVLQVLLALCTSGAV
jgi:hypothetical protein